MPQSSPPPAATTALPPTTITGTALAPFLHGHTALDSGAHGGLAPHRLTPVARTQVDDALMRWVSANATGVRLLARVDAPRLTVTVHTTTTAAAGTPVSELGTPGIVVRTAAGQQIVPLPTFDVAWQTAPGQRAFVDSGAPVTFEIALPGDGPDAPAADVPDRRGTVVEVLLPHANPIEIIGLSAAGTIEPVSDPRPIWLHYGSSISHCANAPDPSQTWVQRVADGWDVQQRNLAFGGNAQADQFVARIIRDSPAQLISLSIGINVINGDTMRERVLRPAVHGFLDTIRDGHPDTPIVVVGAIYCPFHERSAGPLVDVDGHYRSAHRDIESDIGALTLRRARTIVRDVTAQRSATDQNLHYVEGLDLLGPQDAALLHDALHPSPEGNDLIAARILKRWPVFPAAGA